MNKPSDSMKTIDDRTSKNGQLCAIALRQGALRQGFVSTALTFLIAFTQFCTNLCAEEALRLSSVLLTVTETAEVSAARGGILSKLLVREGQLVQPHQLVAELNNAKALVEVEEAQIELRMAQEVAKDDVGVRYAQKTREQATSELRRSEAVNSELPGTISERDLELLRLAIERSELEIERAEKEFRLANMKLKQHQASIRKAKLELVEHSFLAPIAGMVVSVFKRSGEWIEPGDDIVKIVSINRVRAEGFLPAEHAPLDLLGRSAELIVVASKSSTIRVQGKITFVSPEVNPVNGKVRIWSEFDCENTPLRPGLRGTVQIRSIDYGKK